MPTISFSVHRRAVEVTREGHVQMPPSRNVCWPQLPSVRLPWTSHVEERLEGIMRKDSPHVPVFGTLGAMPQIITGHLMQWNLIEI